MSERRKNILTITLGVVVGILSLAVGSLRTHSGVLIPGLIVYALGVLTIRFPEGTYFFLRRWRYQEQKLSDAGRLVQQICGWLMAIFGALLMSGLLMPHLS